METILMRNGEVVEPTTPVVEAAPEAKTTSWKRDQMTSLKPELKPGEWRRIERTLNEGSGTYSSPQLKKLRRDGLSVQVCDFGVSENARSKYGYELSVVVDFGPAFYGGVTSEQVDNVVLEHAIGDFLVKLQTYLRAKEKGSDETIESRVMKVTTLKRLSIKTWEADLGRATVRGPMTEEQKKARQRAIGESAFKAMEVKDQLNLLAGLPDETLLAMNMTQEQVDKLKGRK